MDTITSPSDRSPIMRLSVYEAGKYRYIVGMTVVAAVLLSLVAATGYLLMLGDDRYKLSFAFAVALGVAFASLKTAHGSQRRAFARAASSVIPSPAPAASLALVDPVQEATFVDGLRQIKVPLGEAFDVLVDF